MSTDKLKEIEERRAARAARTDAAQAEQDVIDLEALDAAEELYGHRRVATVTIPFKEGLPRTLVVRTPAPREHKRFNDLREKQERKAVEFLTDDCVVYPAGDARNAVWEANPGARENCAVVAVKLAQGRAADDAKP